MGSESLVHVFLVSFPGQGHVNPLLRLVKRIASKGLLVTLCTPEGWAKQMRKASNIFDEPTPIGNGFFQFESFDDGWPEDRPRHHDLDQDFPQLDLVGRELLPCMLKAHTDQVTCLINNPFIPWVTDVVESLSLPSTMLWVQTCSCFSAYYHYYHKPFPFPSEDQMEIFVQIFTITSLPNGGCERGRRDTGLRRTKLSFYVITYSPKGPHAYPFFRFHSLRYIPNFPYIF